MSHLKINSPDFNNEFTKKYKKHTIPASIKKKTVKELCNPKKFKLQTPQKFVADYINPKTNYKGLLVFHKIGSGKTCSAINIGEQWKGKRKIIVVLPAALKGNFMDELRSQCAGENYITKKEREFIKKTDDIKKRQLVIKKTEERIKKYYSVYSYHKFTDNIDKISLKNTLLIIDEIQNMISEHGTFYHALKKKIFSAPDDLRVVLLSATPIFDKPVELALTLNLLRPDKLLPVGNTFNNIFLERKTTNNQLIKYDFINKDIFVESMKGLVSYYRGAPEKTFPTYNLKYVKCVMEPHQYSSYKKSHSKDQKNNSSIDIISLPTNFFIGSRVTSNIVFPNKKHNREGYTALSKEKMKPQQLKKYSIKFYKILKKIKSATGPVFVFSNFKEYGGIKTFIKILQANNYYDYKFRNMVPTRKQNTAKYYAVWSGDETHEYKELVKTIFNKKNSQLRVLLGSPSIKEGVSLLRVKQVHILEPYWNMSRLKQVIGRAIRYCSHKDLPRDERHVDVYVYIAIRPNEYEFSKRNPEDMSIDRYIMYLAKNKGELISEFEQLLKEHAIDCELNKNLNQNKNNPLICFKDYSK